MSTGTAAPTKGYEATTPAGIRVYFQSEPKRLYRVDDVEVPSVTSVLGVLEKGGLSHWGQGVGIEGTLEMIRQGWIGRAGKGPCIQTQDGIFPATKENVTELLKQHKLTVNHTLTKAGDRGSSVHRGLEEWGETRTLPDPGFYPPEEEGYVRGLLRFIEDVKLAARPAIATEVMVGSVEHGFAGRYDLRMNIDECELVVKKTPVRGETREVFPKGTYLWDAKTSSGVYDSHALQLEAYEGASVECGYKPSLGRLVLRLDKDGWYEVRRSRANFGHFLAVKSAYDALAELKATK